VFEDYLYSIQETGVVDLRDAVGSSAAQAIGLQMHAAHSIDLDKCLLQLSTLSSANADSSRNGPASAALASEASKPVIIDVDACINASRHLPALVSVIGSKTNGRYKIQTDSLPALFLITSEVERRLNLRLKEISSDTQVSNYVKSSDKYLLDELFAAIDLHFSTRQLLIEQLSQLNDRAHQYRMIQRRLLVRYKEKNPTALGGIDVILRETYDAITKLSECT